MASSPTSTVRREGSLVVYVLAYCALHKLKMLHVNTVQELTNILVSWSMQREKNGIGDNRGE